MSAPATRTISTVGSNHRFVRITARSLCQGHGSGAGTAATRSGQLANASCRG
jgi:hypothetical protein